MRRRRSRCSYVVEVAFTAVLVATLWIWMTNGGPQWFGEWFAGQMATPR